MEFYHLPTITIADQVHNYHLYELLHRMLHSTTVSKRRKSAKNVELAVHTHQKLVVVFGILHVLQEGVHGFF